MADNDRLHNEKVASFENRFSLAALLVKFCQELPFAQALFLFNKRLGLTNKWPRQAGSGRAAFRA